MTQTVTPPPEYPVLWPDGQQRTRQRTSSRFKTSHSQALKNIRVELEGIAKDSRKPIRFMIITTNATFQDQTPADPAVAVWFHWCDDWHCVAVDSYRKLAENLQAIAKVLEAKRVIMRHAGVEFLRGSFHRSERLALPAPASGWRAVLLFELHEYVDGAAVNKRWRELSKRADQNDPASQRRLNEAREQALKELTP